MPDELQDRDLTLRIISQTVANIMKEVNGIDDILDDSKKSRLFQSVINYLNAAGIQVNQVLPQEIVDAYAQGHELGGQLLQEAGQSDIVGSLTTQVHAQAVQAVAIAGVTDMQAAIRTAGETFMSTINQTLETVQSEIGQGMLQGDATKEITKRVQAHFNTNGLTAFRTIDGRMLPLDFYAMTVTRTKVRDAHVQGAANRYRENGCDLVRFPIRGFTCHICGARERLVVSLDGQTAGYPTAEEIGGLPPFHPNCRHYPIPVIDASEYPPKPFTGRDMRDADSKELYKNEQSIRRKANQEKKQYLAMKAEADANGEPFPTIGVWRRKKRKNDQQWKDLQEKYRASVGRLRTTTQTVNNPPSNAGKIEELQSNISAVIEAGRRPPTAAAIETRRVPEMQPFNKPLKVNYNEDFDKVMIQGVGYKLDREPTEKTKQHIHALVGTANREELQAYWRQLEDSGDLNPDLNIIAKKIDAVYSRRESLYQTDFNIAFGRKESTKLGEGINSLSRDLTPQEENSILNYTGSQSTAINEYFRKGRTGNEGAEENKIHLDRVLEENTIQKDVMVYRGAGFQAVGGTMARDLMAGNFEQYIGASIIDKGYMSTSLGATTSFSGDVGFQIMLPKGSKGMYLEKHTATMGEHEVLLPRGTELKIKEIKKAETGYEFLMEVVGHGRE